MVTVEHLVGDVDFGEGLRWHDGRLWYSDMYRGVFAVSEEGRRERIVTLDDQPSGLGWLPDGRLLVVSMLHQAVLRLEAGGVLVPHADLSGLALGPCNDMVVAADGTAYVTTFGFDAYAGEERRPGCLVRVAPDGAAEVAATDLAFPNGSVILPGGRTLVVGETFTGQYTAFTIGGDGRLADRRTWADVSPSTPDGCSLDIEGGIWFADPAGRSVARVVEGGSVTHRVAIEPTPYACALGGADGCTLFVTTATGFRAEEVAGKGEGSIQTLRAPFPHAGLP